MGITELAVLLDMPPAMAAKLHPVEGFSEEIRGLLMRDGFEGAANALHEGLSPDEDGAKILSAMLEAATVSEREYAKLGIPHEIYIATMKCFSRFVREHREKYGSWGFSTWWWAGRQTSLKLFRVGALEYEMCTEEGPELAVHIPSDADFSPASVERSLAAARAFFRKFFPAYGSAPFTCCSWMLAPALMPLLPPVSNIRAFAERFEIVAEYENAGYEEFLFRCPAGTAVEDYPEKTSLQRAVKAYLLRGNRLGIARGRMKTGGAGE